MINEALVLVNESIENRFEAIQRMIGIAQDLKLLDNQELFYESVLRREAEIPTSVGFGVAIPHGKSETVNEVFVAFLKTKTPFLWDERNGETVNTVFLMGLPEKNGDREHLLLLSQISKKLMNESFRNALQSCETKEEAVRLLNSINEALKETER